MTLGTHTRPPRRRYLDWLIPAVHLALLGLVLVLLVAGCSLPGGRGRIKTPEVTVQAPKDAGTPATVQTSEAGTAVPLPAGSVVTVTEIAAQPAQPATATTPAAPAQPAVKTTTITPGAATEYRHTEAATAASTGTIDTSIAKHRIDVQDRSKLLWVAIACGLGGIVVRQLLPAWPSLSNGLLAGSALAFAAWKFAEIPAWLWLIAVGVVAAIALGYKRAEWDRNGDGIPDALQNKPPPPTVQS